MGLIPFVVCASCLAANEEYSKQIVDLVLRKEMFGMASFLSRDFENYSEVIAVNFSVHKSDSMQLICTYKLGGGHLMVEVPMTSLEAIALVHLENRKPNRTFSLSPEAGEIIGKNIDEILKKPLFGIASKLSRDWESCAFVDVNFFLVKTGWWLFSTAELYVMYKDSNLKSSSLISPMEGVALIHFEKDRVGRAIGFSRDAAVLLTKYLRDAA